MIWEEPGYPCGRAGPGAELSPGDGTRKRHRLSQMAVVATVSSVLVPPRRSTRELLVATVSSR